MQKVKQISIKFFTFLALIHFFLFYSYAQQENIWTLESCINYALENNLQIKLANLNKTSLGISYNQSKQNKLPNLNASSSYNVNFAGATDPTTFEFTNQQISTNSFSLSSNVILYQGGRQDELINKSYLEYQAAALDIEKAKNDISLAITQAFLQVLLGKEQLNSLLNQNQLTKDQKINIEKSISYGILPEGDILNIESQLVQEEASITIAKNNIEVALVNLKQLLDLDILSPFEIDVPAVDIDLIDVNNFYKTEEVINTALQLQPQIKKSNLQMDIAKSNLSLALGAYYPTLSFGGSLSTSYSSARQEVVDFVQDGTSPVGFIDADLSGFGIYDPIPVVAPNFSPVTRKTPYFDQLQANFLQFVGLNLTVPIFNRFVNDNNVSQAKIGFHSAKLNNEIAIQDLEKEINQAYVDAVAALKNYNASSKAADALYDSYIYIKKKYDLGATNYLDLLQAQNRYANSELDKNSNKYRYIFAIKILDFYNGKTIKL